MKTNSVWQKIHDEASLVIKEEPALGSYYYSAILKHDSFSDAISFLLASKLDSDTLPAIEIREIVSSKLLGNPKIEVAMIRDIAAHKERDPACKLFLTPLLYFKGFHALQAYRIAHELWLEGREFLALYLQNQISETFSVDIHPGAVIGGGVMIDHATGIVIGETCVVGNDISILHSVTLGGTGCSEGDRHPTIGDGVLISVGAKILGNIVVGNGAKVGAGSVVLTDVPAHTSVAGVPAQVIGQTSEDRPSLSMQHLWQKLDCD